MQLISVCNSERIIKIGQYCQSYAQMKKGPVFLTRSVVIPFKHSVIRGHVFDEFSGAGLFFVIFAFITGRQHSFYIV